MTDEIILVRDDHKIPWGFRLTGGRDFNSPLTVVRITGQSIAESRGLKAGDIITEINNQKTNNLCHNEAQRYIADGGNFLKFSVLRGSSPAIPPALTPVRGMTPVLPICNFEKKKPTSIISAESVYSLYEDDSFEFLDQDQSEDEYSEFHEPTEEEINQMLLENAEVIEEKGKNVIGVNFKRFIPKCEFIKDSAVFQVLQEEQVYKELSEKEQLKKCPNKRFSTFLAPPDRPIPQPKPKYSPTIKTEHADESENTSESEEKRRSELNDQNELTNEDSSQNETKSDSKEASNNDDRNDSSENETQREAEENETADESNNAGNISENEKQNDFIEENVQLPKTEFEVQLNLIKNTLSSLEQLPSLIQSQLAAIQNQINQLTQLKDNSSSSNDQDEESSSKCDTETAQETGESDENAEFQADYDENHDYDENANEMGQQDSDIQLENGTEPTSTESEVNENNSDDETQQNESNKISDEEEHPKRRPACPLTPLPRPVVLPGGRIWRKPKDAYNEEFIAETLISQAEVLVGSTVGVNFRKYEPPKFDLSNSAVYKLVHNIETKEAGLQNRYTIPSLQDYYQSPISARHFYCANLANRRTAIEEEDSKNENQEEISS